MSEATRQDHVQRIVRVLLHIQHHLDEELSLEQLAAVACFSPYHFHRVFAALVGESVMAHVRRLRLERAALWLLQTERTVLDVALASGYETHEAFTRAFRSCFGQSPSAFRQRHEAVAAPAPTAVHFQGHGEGVRFEPLTYGGSKMDVHIEEWSPRTVAFVRHIGPYEACGSAWGTLCAWAGPRGLLTGEVWMGGISYDDPKITPPERLRYDACLAVPEGTESEGEVGLQTVAGGPYAVALHKGPYERFHETYSALYARWLPDNGWLPGEAPCVEVYLNDPNTTAPEDLLTRVCIPVRKA